MCIRDRAYTYQKGLDKVHTSQADIVITFKSIKTAFLVFTGMMSVKQAYLEHRFSFCLLYTSVYHIDWLK